MEPIESQLSIGRLVVAKDEYYGIYQGVLMRVFKTSVVWRASVLITQSLHGPSNKAIFFPEQYCNRKAYETGKQYNFDLNGIQVLETAI